MIVYQDWIVDRADHLKTLDQVEEEVEEKVVDKECEEETVNVDPQKIRKRDPVLITYIKGFLEELRTFRIVESMRYLHTSNTLSQLLTEGSRDQEECLDLFTWLLVKTVRPLT